MVVRIEVQWKCRLTPVTIGFRYSLRCGRVTTPGAFRLSRFETLEDRAVTVRDRDSMSQERVAIDRLESYLAERLP